jgi:Fe-S cluster biosynthesis and repair protein YggX
MAARTVKCAKLGRELPAIDENTPDGENTLKYCKMIGGPRFAQRVRDSISMEAWKQWLDHQVMVVNEYRLDPMSDEATPILHKHMEAFFFSDEVAIDNYVPPEETGR